MTDPAQYGDPTPVILARMETKLDNALAEQARHTSTLDRHESRITKAENRLTALETRGARDDNSQARQWTSRSMMWVAIGSVSAVATLLLAVLLAVQGAP